MDAWCAQADAIAIEIVDHGSFRLRFSSAKLRVMATPRQGSLAKHAPVLVEQDPTAPWLIPSLCAIAAIAVPGFALTHSVLVFSIIGLPALLLTYALLTRLRSPFSHARGRAVAVLVLLVPLSAASILATIEATDPAIPWGLRPSSILRGANVCVPLAVLILAGLNIRLRLGWLQFACEQLMLLWMTTTAFPYAGEFP